MTEAQRDDLIGYHADRMQVHFIAGNRASAAWHCRIFTRLARERAANLFNDGTEASGQHISCRAGTPSPNQDRNARAEARQEKHE